MYIHACIHVSYLLRHLEVNYDSVIIAGFMIFTCVHTFLGS